jgi:hypothetical protein
VDEHVRALERAVPLQGLLGYLNFSEGKPDPRIQKQINDAYAFSSERGVALPWRILNEALRSQLQALHHGAAGGFRDISQATAVLQLTFDRVLPAYREHHHDLFFHLSEDDLFQPFFLARAFEAILSQRGPWDEESRIVKGTLRRLNDYVGHRPIAVLESRPLGEPYEHERFRPIPLYLRGPGAASGPYRAIVEQAVKILEATDPNLLADAYFDPALLDELALDPRGYDFGHPAEKRPNYCFGEWDPHQIDNQGRYRRYVARQIVLDALRDRLTNRGPLSEEEALFEAAAVFAGTVLMATGVSGAGPNTHDSSTTLSTLVPRIAKYREAFYSSLLERVTGQHGRRLRQEATKTRQAFGGARQHLNHYFAHQRALQLQQRHLALLLAQIGYAGASRRQVAKITVASVRMLTEIHIRLTAGRLHVDRGELARAAEQIPLIEDLIRRGIDCGALADPWNVLGFQGQYPRFTALEDSIRDQRIDDLIQAVDGLLKLYVRVLSEGAAAGTFVAGQDLTKEMKRLAGWWDRFATTTVSDVPKVHGGEATSSAEHVATALAHWRQRGAATADLGFWRQHLDSFKTPKAFALVIDALLRKQDYKAAMALLMTWLGQAEEVPLEEGEFSFHHLALRWMLGVLADVAGEGAKPAPETVAEARALVNKFFDYLEANAEDYWTVPGLDVAGFGEEAAGAKSSAEEDSLYSAAYEDVTYKDTTQNDVEEEVLEVGPQKDFDLEAEAERLEKRLRFSATAARLWNIATRLLRRPGSPPGPKDKSNPEVAWYAQARKNYQDLLKLLDAVHDHEVPAPQGTYESLVEFDRRRVLKERLLGAVIATCMDTALAVGALRGTLGEAGDGDLPELSRPVWEDSVIRLEQALLRGQVSEARALLPKFIEEFRQEPLLYTPLSQGGHPWQILRAILAQTILRALLANLPRQGLIRESYVLLRIAHAMEQGQPLGGTRVTEFDRLFQVACQTVTLAVLDSAAIPQGERVTPEEVADLLEGLMEPFLALWVEHSRTLRVAVLERITEEREWAQLREFIVRYGRDLFSAKFLTPANLSAILHQGVGPYLDYLRDHADPLHPVRLIEDLEKGLSRPEAEQKLELILQVILENYEEYRDYNATTPQSDFGENLYQLLALLRVKASYQRTAWQLRPLVLVHEALARRHHAAAAVWRQQFQGLTGEIAAEHLKELAKLEKAHGMRLRTVADLLEERFVKPLEDDRLCALIEPAMEAARRSDDSGVSELEKELQPYAEHPTGAGLDVPHWLQRLQGEVHRVEATRTALASLAENLFQVPKILVPLGQLRDQLRDWQELAKDET